MDSKKYNNTKLAIGISEGVLTFILIFIFIISGFSFKLVDYLSQYTSNSYILLLIYAGVVGIGSTILFFPLNFYSSFILEHKYKLSNQTFLKWIWEDLKEIFISVIIGIPILLVFFYILNRFENMWWLPFAIFMFIVSVVLAKIVPIFILPLFYKVTPLENDELKEKITALAKDAKLKIESVFKFNMSKNTKKANAAFTGIGKSKRVLLGDTLLDNYSLDEIETVIAHEFGHYKKKHIIKNIVLGTIFSFLTLFLIAFLDKESIYWFHFSAVNQISALPLIALWGMVISLILNPISNYISRRHEYEADEYAVTVTGKSEAFIRTLEKLTEQNLGDKEPNPFVEWFFYSHPSVKKRIEAIRKKTGSNL